MFYKINRGTNNYMHVHIKDLFFRTHIFIFIGVWSVNSSIVQFRLFFSKGLQDMKVNEYLREEVIYNQTEKWRNYKFSPDLYSI